MSRPTLPVTREQVLAFRRGVQALGERLPPGAPSLRRAAWAGLQDSMPRAALLSLHARVDGIRPDGLDDPTLVQVWGPRFSVFVIASDDLAAFTLGRHPQEPRGRVRAEQMADAAARVLGDRELTDREVAGTLGVGNAIRYATTTGTLLIRWDGARAPVMRLTRAPDVEPGQARRELARRYLHVYGPTDAAAFTRWAGVSARAARATFAELVDELVPVHTPIGDRLLLASDEAALLKAATGAGPGVRLLPSGDAFSLLHGADREVLVPDAALRERLWTPRVWPGALLLAGEVTGTWRRSDHVMEIEPWRRLTGAERAAVEAEASTLPLPGLDRDLQIRWVP